MSRNPRLKQDNLFTNLPSEITIDILSRLPIQTAMKAKLVSKSWCSLMETPEFVNSYKSPPCLAVFYRIRHLEEYRVYEVEDGRRYTADSCKHLFVAGAFPHLKPEPVHSSANGLIFLYDPNTWPCKLIICNPVTREHIRLPLPQLSAFERYWSDSYGFGVSRTSGRHKLVRIFHECYSYDVSSDLSCQVYTLGRRKWRSVNAPALVFGINMIGAFLHGNFHWFAHDPEGRPWISCFDLETELFTTLSPPPLLPNAPHSTFKDSHNYRTLSALRGRLGLCDSSFEYEVVIWLMNEYGDERSWTKQLVIELTSPRSIWSGRICALKISKDGDVLLTEGGGHSILRYSGETKAIEIVNLVESNLIIHFSAVCYTPSFLHLETFFPEENVAWF